MIDLPEIVATTRSPSKTKILRILVRDAGVFLALILITLFFSLTAPYFATPENFLKIFVQISINTVLAAGMTFVILVGGIDLSVGSVLALCTVVGARIMTEGQLSPSILIPIALIGCIGTGILCGLINGLISTRWKVPSFIVTLGMLNMAHGAARVASADLAETGAPTALPARHSQRRRSRRCRCQPRPGQARC